MERNDAERHLNRSEEVRERGLKYKTETELWSDLVEGSMAWPDEQQAQLWSAYELARKAHADDYHKDSPYIYHLLRTANRVMYYLEIDDPEVVIAALLHDVVEDHAEKVASGKYDTEQLPASSPIESMNQSERQSAALDQITVLFSAGKASIVAGVTNVPSEEKPHDYEAKLRGYVDKITHAIKDPKVWIVKFSDWCDNGVGIIYGAENRSAERNLHFQRKYGMVLPVLERRFEEPDIQAMLSDSAKAYVLEQIRLGRERLILE